MWVYTKAVLCDEQGPPPDDLRRILTSISECVCWVCADALREHEWVTETNVLWKENEILEALNCDLDVPCSLQWQLLWFSSPSRLNRKFANDGTKIAKYREAVNMAIEITLTAPFERLHTPRTCLLRTAGVVLYNSHDKDWNDEEEMKGWGLGEFPHLLPHDTVSDDELSDV